MMSVPNIGDMMMISQLTWKISRAFAAGQKNAPLEFQEVEIETSNLARALKQFAETLQSGAELTLIQETSEDVQRDIEIILNSCKRIVHDLDYLVDHNQVTKKHRIVGGFAIERTWSDSVLADYAAMSWTREGGDLHSLKELLELHTECITLLVQALQKQVSPVRSTDQQLTLTSDSDSRLRSVVVPMADRINSVDQTPSSLDQQLEEVHRMVDSLLITSSTPQSPPIPARNPARSPTMEASNLSNSRMRSISPSATSPQRTHKRTAQPTSPRHFKAPDQPTSPRPTISIRAPSSPTETLVTSRASSPTQKRVSEFSFGGSSLRYSSSSYASSTASSGGWSNPGTPRDSFISRQPSTSTKKTSSLPRTPEVREPAEHISEDVLPLLPPPAIGYSTHSELERVTSRSTLALYPTTQPDIVKLHRSSTTASQKALFEKEAFRNSAILCDVRGQFVEYSHRISEDDPRDVEMISVSEECRIAVVRKRVHDPESKTVRVVTSIWVFSDDNTVRMELRMDDEQMYIPYSSYFSPTKVSITVPCELKFHDVKHGNRPAKVAKTSWVNYVFDTPQAAALFQNELMGRTLLATFRTEKTMRIHEGIGKSFTYAEQMCALENLRVWEDNDTGAIIGLIHFSADFRNGYLAFYLNSSVNPIKVKDDGDRVVKIKGLRVPIDRGDKAMRKDSVIAAEKGKGKEKVEKEKVISGAKIEFASDMEKREFMEMCKELQKDLIELPDLLGVN